MSGWELHEGDCLAGMRELADRSADAVVTDPPAGISFMGKEWDDDKGGRVQWQAWLSERMAEAWRVLKPGGHALVWALPRTSHWTGTAIEDARFEIRDVHHHIFGTGFPKSLNVSSVMHELLGVTDGEYGTALKPAVEHWILARKPLDGTYTKNIRTHGVGALNVGGCRIGTDWEDPRLGRRSSSGDGLIGTETFAIRSRVVADRLPTSGRWPAHLSLDEYAAALLDEQALADGMHSAGVARKGSSNPKVREASQDWQGPSTQSTGDMHRIGDSGGASRFFYVAKAPRAEKDRGLEGRKRASGGEATGRADGSAGTKNPRAGSGRTGGTRNIHPTVKSIELMRWLVRLVTPPGGLVMDMFAGSGTTGIAALAEGARFLGFELGADYAEIARARLDAASRQQVLFAVPATALITELPRPEQPGLFDSIAASAAGTESRR